MPKRGKECATGPYKHGNRFRIVFREASGASETVSYANESEAIEARDEFNQAAGCRTVGDALMRYLEERKAERGYMTVKYRLYALLRVTEPTMGDILLNLITKKVAEKLYRKRTEEVAVDTHQGELRYARTFFDWCGKQGWVAENPFAEVVPTGEKNRGKPKLRVNATRQFLAVVTADPSMEATAVLTALTLGLRANEVVNRTVEDLDDNGQLLWIRGSKTVNSDREIEVPSWLRLRLMELAKGKALTDKLFGQLTRHGLHYWTVEFCKRAGVPRVTPHGLRGSGATNRVRSGGSVEDVAAWLGHGDDGATAKAHYIGGGAIESARGRTVSELISPVTPSTPDKNATIRLLVVEQPAGNDVLETVTNEQNLELN